MGLENMKKFTLRNISLINAVKFAIAPVSIVLLSACGESTSSNVGPGISVTPTTPTSFNEAQLIANLTDQVITPVYQQFVTDAQAQAELTGQWCTAVANVNSGSGTAAEADTAKENAQAQWRQTMNTWQQIEMMQIGPLVDNENQLRNRIYSWPVTSTCGVDLDTVSFEAGNINGAPFNIKNRTPARRGMDALEYLMFNENLDHSCTSTTFPEGWNARIDSERVLARCQFAEEVANDIHDNSQVLVEQWGGDNGFAAALKNAGNTGSSFGTVHEAVNRISDALFYIDSLTKDAKLALPLGLFANSCGAQACPEEVESPWSKHSLENIKQNLLALQKLYTGQESTGFDDFLADVGDTDTQQQISTAIESALATIEGIEESLASALANNEDEVSKLHGDVKSVTDKLKSDFINSLALELPATSAGDND